MNHKLIINIINSFFNVDITIKSRRQDVTIPRYVCMWILYNYNKKRYTFSYIGDIFGKDHSTAIYGIKLINNLIQTDKNFKIKFYELKEIIDNVIYKDKFHYYEKILDKYATFNMKEWNLNKFKNDNPLLFKSIILSLIEVSNKKL